MTTLSYQQAIDWINNNPSASLQDIKNLVSQVSTNVEGAKTTVFYSGSVNGTQSWQVAEAIAKSNSDVAIISNTDVARLFKNQSFIDKIDSLATNNSLTVDQIFDGTTDINGNRNPDGLWDIASKNLAKSASGDIVTISATSEANSVFKQTELPALLNNSEIKSIDGIPIAELKAAYDNAGGANGNGLNAVNDMVKLSSGSHYAFLDIATSPSNNNGIVVDTKKFFADHPAITGSSFPADATGIKHGSTMLGKMVFNDNFANENFREVVVSGCNDNNIRF